MNPKVKVGKPVIKGTQLAVEYILGLLAHGATFDEILGEYDGLTPEDIQACFVLCHKIGRKHHISTLSRGDHLDEICRR